MNNQLYIQIPLDASYFLKSEFQIDRLLDFCDWSSPASDGDVRQAIELMVPTCCSKELIRIGGSGDGAYLLPDDLSAIDACFSPGVSTLVNFELQLAEDFGIPSYLCDASVDCDQLQLNPEKQFFCRKWLGSFDGDDTQSLDQWVLGSDHADSENLLLQMDIEGAEYRSLLSASDSVLKRFRIVVVEFHMLPFLQSSRFLNTSFLPVLHKLLRRFDCVHAHANNCLPLIDLAGYMVPQVIELSFYRKAENQGPKNSWSSHSLDVVNVPTSPRVVLGAPWV
jgi:hypothetical protein